MLQLIYDWNLFFRSNPIRLKWEYQSDEVVTKKKVPVIIKFQH